MTTQPSAASGRSIRSDTRVIESKRRWTLRDLLRPTRRKMEATVLEGSREVARIGGGLERSRDIVGITAVRRTWVELPSGARWTISTEPDPGSERRGRARQSMVVVRDDLGRTLATAESADKEGWRWARDTVGSPSKSFRGALDAAKDAGRAAGGEVRERRAHRSGLLKWLVVGAFLVFDAFGFLIGAIATAASGQGGVAIGLAIAGLAVLGFGLWALRKWRDPARCWSCGTAIDGRPVACPSCGAGRPASGGLVERGAAPVRSVGSGIGGVAGGVGLAMARQLVTAFDVSSAAGLHRSLWNGGELLIDGIVEAGSRKKGVVTLTPLSDTPLELALLAWHIAVGHELRPQRS